MIKQKFKPNKDILKLKDVEIDVSNMQPDYAEQTLTISTLLPRVFYYGIELPAQNIRKLTVDSNKFLPICYIQFEDTFALLHDIGFPTDNAKLTVILPSNHSALANIFMEFKITNFNVELLRGSSAKKIHMWGTCNIENMLIKEYKSYIDSSSYDIMYKNAQETGLGFMSNVDSSNDKMTWINPGLHNYTFLQDTINKCWIGESSYVWGFVDLFYNLNYIDVEKSLDQDITEIKWIPANIMNNTEILQTETKTTGPILTNDPAFKISNTYFSGEKIINQSTDISLKRGYLRNVHYYDIDGNWENKAGSYKQYQLDTITSQGTGSTTIYLKGEPGDTDFYSKNKTYHYMGLLDTKNMHPDYLWACIQNEENLYDLQKINLVITLPVPNFNIRRFEKIKLLFTNNDNAVKNNKTNIKLNGEWLVTGVTYEWNGSAFYQYVYIVKRELTVGEL